MDFLQEIHSVEARKLGHIPWAHTSKLLRRMGKVAEGNRWKGGFEHYSQSYGRLHRHGLARTITTAFPNAGSGRFWHPTENRTLTLREGARVQGFPDDFRFIEPYSRAAWLVGNALDKALADLTFETIKRCLE